MLRNKTFLGLITARGGSKGIPRKNILPIAGKPNIAWTISAAQQSKHLDRVILSSEDEEIISIARSFGCEVPFVRPAELAGDNVSSAEVALHALDSLAESYDYLVLLQPTSPLRTAEDIDHCIERCLEINAPGVISVTEVDKSPQWMYWLAEDGSMKTVVTDRPLPLRRQDAQSAYAINGSVFVVSVDWFRKHRTFHAPEIGGCAIPVERGLDLDTPEDIIKAERILRQTPAPVEHVRTHDLEVYTKESRYQDPKEIFKLLVDKAMAAGAIAPGKTVGDFGCAAGEFLYHVAQRSPESRLVGYDVVEPLLAKARGAVPSAEFLTGSVTDSDLCAENSFDATFCTGVLSIFDECLTSLGNMIRWTREGGRVYATTLFNPYPFNVWVQYAPSGQDSSAPRETGYNMFSQQDVAAFLQPRVKSFSFQPWILPFDQAPMPEDFARKWTFRDESGNKLFTNGLSLLLPMQFLEIEV